MKPMFHVGTITVLALLAGISGSPAHAQTMDQQPSAAPSGTPDAQGTGNEQTSQPYDAPASTTGGGGAGGAGGAGGGAGGGGK